MQALPAASTCPVFEVVWFEEPYNSTNSPSREWREHIYNVDDNCKGKLWSHIARVFSKAYYYPASAFTPIEAVEATINITGVPEGVYPMESFLHAIAYKSSTSCLSGL
jgi:hypothetical protein